MIKEELKKQQVYQVLITPIKYTKKRTILEEAIIEMKEDVIYSTQLYEGMLDCDMTDITCGFYQILYKDFLKSKNIESIINNECELSDVEFAGDTMNSFHTVANLVKEAGNSRKLRTNESTWPLYLKEYKHAYHCLANFWLVPMVIGRTGLTLSKSNCAWDYMDRFLKVLKRDFKTYKEEYPNYFSGLGESFDEFIKINYLEDSYIKNNERVIFSEPPKAEAIIAMIYQLNQERAMIITESDKVDELWEYFNKYGLIN